MDDYKALLEKARKLHGEFCPGIVIGTKMCMSAMKRLDMDPMKPNDNLVVYVEIDRCLPDAIQAITGCSLGNRKLKYHDYGKFIATFVDTAHSKAVRISALDDKLDSYPGFWTWLKNTLISTNHTNLSPKKEEIEFAAHMICGIPDDELLLMEEVHREVPENDVPSFPGHVAVCSVCGEHVMDFKEFTVEGKSICRSCTQKSVEIVVNQAFLQHCEF